MGCDLTTLPIEIQETILTKLSGQALLSVSKVCKLWHNICEWIAKERCSKVIPEECVREVESSGKYDDVWLTVVNNYFLQQYLLKNMLDHEKNLVVELNVNEHLCFCVHGPFIFIGCDSGKIEVYNPEQASLPVLTMTSLKMPIFHIEVMTNINVLLAKSGRNELEFFSLPYLSGKSWVYKMVHLKPVFQNYTNELHCEKNFSMYDSTLAVVTSPHEVCLFKLATSGNTTIKLKCLTNYITEEAVAHVSLWLEEVIILFKSGEILYWCLTTQGSILSDRYHEIHYENPVWIFRGRIFCSTFISSQLLGYWHMNRGADYWLVGKPTCDLVRCRDLGTMFSAETGIEDVLCVCLKQRLLACGTKDGKILLYYLSDRFFSCDEQNLNGNEHLKVEFNRVPDLTICTKERPIKNIAIVFCEDSIKIYTWYSKISVPYMVSSGPGSKGLLQYVVLKEGHWVEQSDKDMIDI
ncbi:hypothetical protein RUM44_002353 [Polyplax serrata]|uniref:F-box domain-containing protein n=1 Tax=Polyplax serrata TaxID=468196 RepID=A0ABR1AMM6_POLSC